MQWWGARFPEQVRSFPSCGAAARRGPVHVGRAGGGDGGLTVHRGTGQIVNTARATGAGFLTGGE